ncbi:uncharacterized protein LOC131940577 [Physella acuta]|uniref:uncharacterized protein LOC131940577 n=1 Tax=Physella acuta TaxID=109671 RepID=UPI0027DDB119|nr:uncharacterized protein LOC131940577 [Physella acuta]XP_059155252.1 uncharacterized protein LOC131940577 [Physella acuta]
MPEIVDVAKIVAGHIAEVADSEAKRKYLTKKPQLDFQFLHVESGETNYTRRDMAPVETTNILYTSCYSNNTPNEQKYVLNSLRKTRSVFEVSFSRGLKLGNEFSIDINPPSTKGGLHAGFKKEEEEAQGNKVLNMQELKWVIDNVIMVPAHHWVKVEVIVKEENYNGEFEKLLTFDGDIVVHLLKKEKDIVERFQSLIYNAMRGTRVKRVSTGCEKLTFPVHTIMTPARGFVLDNNGKPTYMVKGHCECRFGVEQEVIITEYPGIKPDYRINPSW